MTLFPKNVEHIKETALGAFLSGVNDVAMKDSIPYIDRDPDTFKHLVRYLNDDFKLPNHLDKRATWLLRKEFEHWLIPFRHLSLQIGIFNQKPKNLEASALSSWLSSEKLNVES